MKHCLLFLFLLCSFTGCDRLGLADPAKEAEAKDAEGKAIGGACRHSGRALEDCYTLNPSAGKASIFAGWKDMNDYMIQNKIEVVKPEIMPGTLIVAKRKASDASDETTAEPEESKPTTAARRRAARADSGTH